MRIVLIALLLTCTSAYAHDDYSELLNLMRESEQRASSERLRVRQEETRRRNAEFKARMREPGPLEEYMRRWD